ncbi:MAG: choline-sulfatase [Anaerolineales bacterium]|nr:choline-sulfatase [Anaerolineales bacterium]
MNERKLYNNPGNGEKWNILLILADQLTPFLTGAYGHKVVRTPNLDQLAAGGICFDAAYSSSPLCVPARASLLTGRYASTIGCFDNGSPFSCEEPCIAHYLTMEGYDSIASGKMHFIGPDQLHGFSRRLTTDIYPSDFSWTPHSEFKSTPMFKENPHASGYALPNVGVRKWSMGLAYDEETTFRALEFIHARALKPPQRPFFLCVSFTLPHGPFHVTRELWELYEDESIELPTIPVNVQEHYTIMDRWLHAYHGLDKVPNLLDPDSLYAMRRSYYGLVTQVDRKVGELLRALEQTGQREHTMILFASDHGDMLGEKGLVQKKMFYEWSARVPLIINFPDGWKKGSKCNRPVSLVDLAPTLLDIAGVRERLDLDGTSLFQTLRDESRKEAVFSEIHAEGVYAPCFMVRRAQYKYIYMHENGAQLFDLQADPHEWRNLSGSSKFKGLEEELMGCILKRFDPDLIARRVQDSIPKRKLVRKAMELSDTHWDWDPYQRCAPSKIDCTTQYIRRHSGPIVDD